MKDKFSVTIVIPAYNEEANVADLLKNLCRQQESEGSIDRIIVVSDGSSDRTAECARSVNDQRIVVVEKLDREGKNVALQHIATVAHGDVLLLLDADTIPQHQDLIDRVVRRFRENPALDLVGLHTESLPGRSFVERVVARSHGMKNDLYARINHGNTVYLFHGRACALSRRLYKSLVWPVNCPEDAYTYLSCIHRGWRFQYAPEAVILFRSPSTFGDYATQSQRFRNGQTALEHVFNQRFLKKEYAIPAALKIQALVSWFIHEPVYTLFYGLMNMVSQVQCASHVEHHPLWEIATTSKHLRQTVTKAS